MSRLAEPVRLEAAVANRVLGDAKRLIGRVLADMVNNLNPVCWYGMVSWRWPVNQFWSESGIHLVLAPDMSS
jgi:hypothetical protein